MTSSNKDKPYRVLALDGGGMRGLYTAKLLEILAQRFDDQFTGSIQPDIGAAFDLICGTSTGAILACALAAGVPLDRVRHLYSHEGATIFPDPIPKTDARGTIGELYIPLLWKWAWKERSKAAGCASHLHAVLSEIFGEEDLGDVFNRRSIGLCIPTVNAVKHHPVVLKTPHIPEKHRDNKCKLADVCMSSSAAPIFLPLHPVEDADEPKSKQFYADGGLWANNPVMVGVIEALQVTEGKRPIHVTSAGTCSIPTGDPAAVMNPDWGIAQWRAGVGIVEMSMSAQAAGSTYAATQLAQSLRKCGLSIDVIRLPEQARSPQECSAIGLDRSDETAIHTLLELARRDADEIHSQVLLGKLDGHEILRQTFSGLSPLTTPTQKDGNDV